MNASIDLHIHTRFSDGTCSPAELLTIVRRSRLSAFSVTDHDTLDGYRTVRQLLQADDPELVPGVELSVTMDGDDLHMLGYLFDPDNGKLNDALTAFRERRNQRARSMVQKLNDLHVDISFKDVETAAGGAAVGRPHVADALLKAQAVGSYDEAFDRYIHTGGPAYVAKTNFAPDQAVSLLHEAGGVAVLAHPAINDAARFIESLVRLGLDGIEVWHPLHSLRNRRRFSHLAQRFRLVTSGGSDFHGRFDTDKYGTIGSQHVPAACLARLKQQALQYRGTH